MADEANVDLEASLLQMLGELTDRQQQGEYGNEVVIKCYTILSMFEKLWNEHF